MILLLTVISAIRTLNETEKFTWQQEPGILPTFQQVYDCLKKHGPAIVRSSRGTQYEVYAERRKNQPVIVGYPRKGEVRIHNDCWKKDITCQGTRAGGIINGEPSIYDWYHETCGGKTV